MDLPNIQWWAKPAPNDNTSPATTGGFTIPGLGLGNTANNGPSPFNIARASSAARATPAVKQSAVAEQPKIPTGPRASGAKAKPQNRDSIIAPSAASGGVPEPTEEYMLRASLPPTLLPAPRPILVVLDLNGTLLHRPNRRAATTFIERPHAKRFVQYCLDTFHVVVWSSARPANVQSMCDQLLLGSPISGPNAADRALYRRRVLAIWGRDRFGLSSADYKVRVQVYKRLDMVWADKNVQAAHPDAAFGGRWDQSNTVLVDDSIEKARSEPFNLLRIPEFFGDANEPGFVVPQVHDYLNSLAYQGDISAYMRENPFKLHDGYRLAPTEEQQ
ncbi:putative FCP1 homology domain-containing protein [Colletotrichum chlorophyti]|uniref:Mitochondrial import inner membrane translocase subunit TIM50 n=1 Tax=Colletotrichum chlorophyti TaxID=708187 RepID=A0A1Q8RJI1_9PEZI|nr:putative FCP1 homology domain-containing protein [Colletotrichum chlorophyti]